MSRKVFVVNKSAHDYSDAERFGELIYLSNGPMDRYGINAIHRKFEYTLRESLEVDYILICGLTVMNIVACSIFSSLHGRLNLLLFKSGKYIERNLIIGKEPCNATTSPASI